MADDLRWACQNNNIVLIAPDERVLPVSAAEIVGAEFKGRFNIREYELNRRPSQDLADIRFNRFPLNVALIVTRPGKQTPPECRLEVCDADYKYEIPLPLSFTDQLIIETNWFPVVTDDVEVINRVISEAKILETGSISLRQYLDLAILNLEQIVFEDNTNISSEPSDAAIENVFLQPGFQGKLYQYQATGVKWLQSIISEDLGCILGDEMGLGKTVQIIAVLVSENHAFRKPSLIISPATLVENWLRELSRFAPTLTMEIHHGRERTGFPSHLKQFDIVITSYETAVRDLPLFKMIQWNLVILDEAQSIKNPDALRSSTIKMIPRRAGIAVTGTPVENRLSDLWSLMDFACPGLLRDLDSFEKRFADDVDGASLLEPVVTPLMLRRLVSEVANDLPPRIDIPQPINLSDSAAIEYSRLRDEIVNEYGKSANLVALTKLRMFCAHPFLLNSAHGDPSMFSTKYFRLLELLDEIVSNGRKTLIFTSYNGMTDIMVQDLSERYSIFCRWIDGRIAVKERQHIIDQFYKVTTPAILILNPRAAGTGLNITTANHVIHYNLEWNPAVEDQATARTYRRGQDRPVTVHRLFHPGTVEEVINDRIESKRLLARTAVVGTKGEPEERVYIMRALEMSPVISRSHENE